MSYLDLLYMCRSVVNERLQGEKAKKKNTINTKIWKIDSSPLTDKEIEECYEDHRNRRNSS